MTLDRVIVDKWRLPINQGGLNNVLTGGEPAPCFTSALTDYMNSQVVTANNDTQYPCAMVLPPWGYWGKPPAACQLKPGAGPPSCSSMNISAPCPLVPPGRNASSTPPPKTTDSCGNPVPFQIQQPVTRYDNATGTNVTSLISINITMPCMPDCLWNINQACSLLLKPYSGPPHACLADPKTETMKQAMFVMYIFASICSAVGVGFCVVYGVMLRKIRNSILRHRATAIWLSISYFFISWYPHSELHELYSGGDSYNLQIITELVFHWPMALCGAVLSYYQYDLLLLLYESIILRQQFATWEMKNKLPWYKNFKIQAAIAFIMGWAFFLAVQYGLRPIPTGQDPGLAGWSKGLWSTCWPKPWQQAFLYSFWIVDPFVGGVGCGFIFVSWRILRELPPSRQRNISVISSICIFYCLTLAGFHSFVHAYVPPCPVNVIVIDYVIHLSFIAAVCVLGYFQFKILELSLNPTSLLAVATNMRGKKMSHTTHSGNSSEVHSNGEKHHGGHIELSESGYKDQDQDTSSSMD
eukprot:TRINITY_DN1586_c0_g1_i2.p1 TRINITY_DN1586_c0_g1~~TRINITY_DN1586_c0_g1_i2.p1  ORF type:complete len:563 (+),score=119.30 TRINITY_DN1586_c0_g1_i2:117-1691(+)